LPGESPPLKVFEIG